MPSNNSKLELLQNELQRRNQKRVLDELNEKIGLKPYAFKNIPPPIVSLIEVEHAMEITIQNLLTGYVFQEMTSSRILSFMMSLRNEGNLLQCRFQFFDINLKYRPTAEESLWVLVPLDVRARTEDYEKLNFSIRVAGFPNDSVFSFLERRLPTIFKIRMIPREKILTKEEVREHEKLEMHTPTIEEPSVVDESCDKNNDDNDLSTCNDPNCSQQSTMSSSGAGADGDDGAPVKKLNNVQQALHATPPRCSQEWNESLFLTGKDGIVMGDIRPYKPEPVKTESETESEAESKTDDSTSTSASSTSMSTDENDEKLTSSSKLVIEDKKFEDPKTGDTTEKIKEVLQDSDGNKREICEEVKRDENGNTIKEKLEIVEIVEPTKSSISPVIFSKESINAFNYISSRLSLNLADVCKPAVLKVPDPVKDEKGNIVDIPRPKYVYFPWVIEDIIPDLETVGIVKGRCVTVYVRPMFWCKSSDKYILAAHEQRLETEMRLIKETHPDHAQFTAALANVRDYQQSLRMMEYLHLEYFTDRDYTKSVLPIHRNNKHLPSLLPLRNVEITNPGAFAAGITFRERDGNRWVCTDCKIAHDENDVGIKQALEEISLGFVARLQHEYHRGENVRITHDQESTIL